MNIEKNEISRLLEDMEIQHHTLENMLKSLCDMSSNNVFGTEVSEALNAMTTYANKHFHHEESLMERLNYPSYAKHKKQHENFTLKTAYLCLDVAAGKAGALVEVTNYLAEWMQQHAKHDDVELDEFLLQF